jgi:hypothetical protein
MQDSQKVINLGSALLHTIDDIQPFFLKSCSHLVSISHYYLYQLNFLVNIISMVNKVKGGGNYFLKMR